MDLQSFIQSGLIEAYVLGQCTPSERAEVERMAAQYAEVRNELVATEKALEQYAQAHAATPPAWMKGRILDLVGREPAASAPVDPPRPTSTRWLTWALAAACVLLLANIWRFDTINHDLQRQNADCLERNRQMEGLQQRVAFFEHPDTRQIALKDSVHSAPMYHNPATCRVAVDVAALPPKPAGKFYQFWAIVDGKPQNMGMVQAGTTWQDFACAPGATAYAISEEDKPEGNPAPTLVRLVAPTAG